MGFTYIIYSKFHHIFLTLQLMYIENDEHISQCHIWLQSVLVVQSHHIPIPSLNHTSIKLYANLVFTIDILLMIFLHYSLIVINCIAQVQRYQGVISLSDIIRLQTMISGDQFKSGGCQKISAILSILQFNSVSHPLFCTVIFSKHFYGKKLKLIPRCLKAGYD